MTALIVQLLVVIKCDNPSSRLTVLWCYINFVLLLLLLSIIIRSDRRS